MYGCEKYSPHAKAKELTVAGREKGFNFIEILSACPTNWKLAHNSIKWMQESMETI